MGMDLIPIRPTKKAPRYPSDHKYWPNQVIAGRYNIHAWDWLVKKLKQWGVDTSELSYMNDGDKISATTCKKIASAIELNLHKLDQQEQDWIYPDIILWKTCGGYRQF